MNNKEPLPYFNWLEKNNLRDIVENWFVWYNLRCNFLKELKKDKKKYIGYLKNLEIEKEKYYEKMKMKFDHNNYIQSIEIEKEKYYDSIK